MYKQLDQIDHDTDLRICEFCGKTFMIKDGYAISAFWLVTGHPLVKAFPCEETQHNPNIIDQRGPHHSGQHWGCTPEHAVEAMKYCLENHMVQQLKQKHQSVKDLNKK